MKPAGSDKAFGDGGRRLYSLGTPKGTTVRTLAIVNQKGGCGKTTTAINLAAVFSRRGQRTLLVDMDPQAHCAAGLGVPEDRIEGSVCDVLLAEPGQSMDPGRCLWEVSTHLQLLPSTVKLAGLEAAGGGLATLDDKDRRLTRALQRFEASFDVCIIDCPPTIGLLTFNALRAAREAIIPVETGYFALRGAERQWTTIRTLIERLSRPIICHLLPTLYKPHSRLDREILSSLRRAFPGQSLPLTIHEHQALREAASFGQPVFEYAPDSPACRDYEALADWLADHVPPSLEELAAGGAVLERPTEVCPPPASRPPVRSTIAGGTRAAELANRLRGLTRFDELVSDRIDPEPEPAPSPRPEPIPVARRRSSVTVAAPVAPSIGRTATAGRVAEIALRLDRGPVAHLYGARQTASGTLFVQPATLGQRIFVAGDFNEWSAVANPMRYSESIDAFELLVPLEPGRHQYRLVVDGVWCVDAYNPNTSPNDYGEANSVVNVLALPK